MSDEVQRFTSVWDAIADTPEEAANLRARADLLLAIEAKLNELGWPQTVTAANLGLTQPRVSDLVRGKISNSDAMPGSAGHYSGWPAWGRKRLPSPRRCPGPKFLNLTADAKSSKVGGPIS